MSRKELDHKMKPGSRIEEIIRLMESDRSVDAPDDAIRWARNLGSRLSVKERETFLQKVIAVLKADILPQAPVFGERSASTGAARQVLFEAGDHAIDLRIKSVAPGSFSIQGQVISNEALGGGQFVLESEAASLRSDLDDTGGFAMEEVPGGTYALRVILASAEIEGQLTV